MVPGSWRELYHVNKPLAVSSKGSFGSKAREWKSGETNRRHHSRCFGQYATHHTSCSAGLRLQLQTALLTSLDPRPSCESELDLPSSFPHHCSFSNNTLHNSSHLSTSFSIHPALNQPSFHNVDLCQTPLDARLQGALPPFCPITSYPICAPSAEKKNPSTHTCPFSGSEMPA